MSIMCSGTRGPDVPRGACRQGGTAAEAAGWGVLIAPEHQKPPVQLWRSEGLLDSDAPLPLGSTTAAAVLGWGWRLLCGRIGCFYEVLSAGKKRNRKKGPCCRRAAVGDAFAPGIHLALAPCPRPTSGLLLRSLWSHSAHRHKAWTPSPGGSCGSPCPAGMWRTR